MRIAALILGILGGLVALVYGFFGYGLGSIADAGEAGAGSGLKFLSLGMPVACLVGAGVVLQKPVIGASLMAIAAVGFVVTLGFNAFSLVPIVLIGLGAFLGFLGAQNGAQTG